MGIDYLPETKNYPQITLVLILISRMMRLHLLRLLKNIWFAVRPGKKKSLSL